MEENKKTLVDAIKVNCEYYCDILKKGVPVEAIVQLYQDGATDVLCKSFGSKKRCMHDWLEKYCPYYKEGGE